MYKIRNMLQASSSSQPHRIVWVDVLRFLAIFMVICIHCADPFNVSPEARSNPEFNFWGSIYGSFLRPCVPLFVMITGLLLLPVNMPIQSFYKKRLLRIAVPFLVWSVLYNLFPWITGVLGLSSAVIADVFAYASPDASQSFGDAMTNIALIPFKFNVYTVPMWYLYMLIGLYLYMPFFSAWIEKANLSQKKIFLGIWGITLFAIGYIVTYIGFKSITANPDCTEQEMEMFFLYCSPNVVLMTIAVFLIIRRIRFTSPGWVSLFSNITKCGLGIYLIHYFMVGFSYGIANILSIPISVKIPVTAIIAFAVSWGVVAFFYRFIPKVAKWIFG